MTDYKATNSLGVRKLYESRKKFKETAWPLAEMHRPIDFIYENTTYGFRNANNETIYPFLDGVARPSMRSIDNTEIEVLLFVADAFHDFKEFYINFIDTVPGAVSPTEIGGLEPVRGFEDSTEKYNTYLEVMKNFIINKILPDYKIHNFSDFALVMNDYINNYAKEFPLTRSGFLDSSNCGLHSTGLVLDMSTLDASADAPKVPLINNKIYRCYSTFAAEHGFYIDKNVPWRLVANVESPIMRRYITKYGPTSMTNSQILDTRFYAKSHFDDYHDVQDFFLAVYNEYVLDNPFSVEYNEKNRSFMERKSIIWFDEKKYGSDFWIDYLFRLRLAETNTQISTNEYNHNKYQIIESMRVYDINFAIGKIGMLIASMRPGVKIENSFRETKLRDFYGNIPDNK